MQYKHKAFLLKKDQIQAGWCWLVLYHSLLCECLLSASGVNISMAEHDACKGAVGRSCIRKQHYTAGSSIRWSRGTTSFMQFGCNSTSLYVQIMECCHNILNVFLQHFWDLTEDSVCIEEEFLCECVWSRRGLALIALVVRAPVTCDTRIHQSMM